VAAWQPNQIEIDSMRSYFVDYLMRQLDWKSQIVARRDETHRTLLHLAQTRNERHRTNRRPELAQLIYSQISFDPARTCCVEISLPNHVSNIARHVIENTDVDRRLVREGEKTDARTDAGAEDSDPFKSCSFSQRTAARVSKTAWRIDWIVRPMLEPTR